MPEYIYRVVRQDGTPIGGGTFQGGRQHFYPKESTAKSVAKQNGYRLGPNGEREYIYRVQRGIVTWEDIDNV